MDRLKKTQKTVCFVAGKSGGHIIPCLTLAHQAKASGADIIFITTKSLLDARIIAADAMKKKHVTLLLGTKAYNKWYHFLIVLWHGIASIVMSMYVMLRYRPSMVISSGGLVSLPVCIAAYIVRIPISVYELNAVPGRATLFLSYIATHFYVCFKSAQRYLKKPTIIANYPLRFADKIATSSNSKLFTLCIIGGSQGSVGINKLMRMWLENNVHMHPYVTIIHQIGHQDYTDWNALYKRYDISVQVFDFCDTMQQVYQQAHLAISRAGAGSLFELLYFNVPSLIIPLQTASTTHQKNNAYAMASEYPALFTVMEEAIIFMKPVSFYDYINAAIYAHISKHSVLAEELHQDRHDMTSFVP